MLPPLFQCIVFTFIYISLHRVQSCEDDSSRFDWLTKECFSSYRSNIYLPEIFTSTRVHPVVAFRIVDLDIPSGVCLWTAISTHPERLNFSIIHSCALVSGFLRIMFLVELPLHIYPIVTHQDPFCGHVLCSSTHGRPHWLASCKVPVPVDAIHSSCSTTHFIRHHLGFPWHLIYQTCQVCHTKLSWEDTPYFNIPFTFLACLLSLIIYVQAVMLLFTLHTSLKSHFSNVMSYLTEE